MLSIVTAEPAPSPPNIQPTPAALEAYALWLHSQADAHVRLCCVHGSGLYGNAEDEDGQNGQGLKDDNKNRYSNLT